MKIGIYSGTFDPIHEGHIALAKAALERGGLDKIFFLVEPRPRRKQGVKAFEHRTAMVKLAIKKEARFGSIILEQQRFTPADTLPLLTERFKGAELHMLMGDDMLDHLASWPQVKYLLEAVDFVIGARRNDKSSVESVIKTLEKTRGIKLRYRIIEIDLSKVSSSQIRAIIKRGHKPKQLTEPVWEYIGEQKLYASVKAE